MKPKDKYIILTFILVEAILYLTFLLINDYDIGVKLRYLTIILCCGFLHLYSLKVYDIKLMRIALVLTLVSDYFLLIRNDIIIVGVISFCLVQLLYAYRLFKANPSHQKIRLIVYILSIFIIQLIVFTTVIKEFDGLVFAAIIYFVTLVNNFINAAIYYKYNYLFALGLFLFIGCDIFVGLSSLSVYLNINDSSFVGKLIKIPFDMAWFFYVPSQVLLVLSIYKKSRRTNAYYI
jgi:hypothetical protein